MHYKDIEGTARNAGGIKRFCPGDTGGNSQVAGDGSCPVTLQQSYRIPNSAGGNDIVPGVTIRTSQTCSAIGTQTDELGGMGYTSFTPAEYHLSFGQSRPSPSAGTQAARTYNFKAPTPRSSTKIDAWAIVIE
jgi:hypothetical protein